MYQQQPYQQLEECRYLVCNRNFEEEYNRPNDKQRDAMPQSPEDSK
jgi:hypothetical protein